MPHGGGTAKGSLSRADLEAVLGIVRLAYEGLAHREAWGEMLRQVRLLFGARDAWLVRIPAAAESTQLVLAPDVEPAILEIYSGKKKVPFRAFIRVREEKPRARRMSSSLPSLGFTRRESEVAQELLAGRGTDQICGRLLISRETLERHLQHLLEKTGAESRSQLAASLYEAVLPEELAEPEGSRAS